MTLIIDQFKVQLIIMDNRSIQHQLQDISFYFSDEDKDLKGKDTQWNIINSSFQGQVKLINNNPSAMHMRQHQVISLQNLAEKDKIPSSLGKEKDQMELDDCHEEESISLNWVFQESDAENQDSSKGQKQQKQAKAVQKIKIISKSSKNSIKCSQGSSHSSRLKFEDRQRKIRTPVSQQKVRIMEYLFPYVLNNIPHEGTTLTLKDVSKIADLGYSTILHKYRDYRNKGMVEKGLLLQCKDVKRKYTKSLVIQKYIKAALKQNNFKTAKQLGNYINQKYKVNANRSIVSRHLNQMQRQKFQDIGQKELRTLQNIKYEDQSQYEYDKRQGNYNQNLKKWCRLYFGLRQNLKSFYYVSAIRLYLVDDFIVDDIEGYQGNYFPINLLVSANEFQLIDVKIQIFERPQHRATQSRYFQPVYKSLYKYLAQQLKATEQRNKSVNSIINQEQHWISQWMAQTYEEVCYFLYPLSNYKRQFQLRCQVIQLFHSRNSDLLLLPARLKEGNVNFIKNWFQKQVLPCISNKKIQNMNKCINQQMKGKQTYLGKYFRESYQRLKKIA